MLQISSCYMFSNSVETLKNSQKGWVENSILFESLKVFKIFTLSLRWYFSTPSLSGGGLYKLSSLVLLVNYRLI